MNIKEILFVGIITITSLSSSVQAALIGVSEGNFGDVYEIDSATGLATNLVPMQNTTGFTGATFLGGQLYASDVTYLGPHALGTIDTTTGVFSFVNNQGGSNNWHGLASDESAGLMYAIDLDDGTKLKSIALDGVIATIGTGTGIEGHGMAYDDTNNILYATSFSGGLYTVDTVLGTASLIGNMGEGIDTNWIGLAFDEASATLYANSASSLFTLDVTTGAASLIGGNGVTGIDSLAWYDDTAVVPVPATAWLFCSGLIGLIGIARRKKA